MSERTKMAFEAKWRIEGIQSWLQNRDDTIYSPQFLAKTLMNTCWKLKLSPEWQLDEKYVCLTLQRNVEDDGPELIALNYELSFLACDASPLKSKSCGKKFASKTVSNGLSVKQVDILEEKGENYLSDGVLTVFCKLWKTGSAVSELEKCTIQSVIGTKSISLYSSFYDFTVARDSILFLNFMSPSADISSISFRVKVGDPEFTFEKLKVVCKCFTVYSCTICGLSFEGYPLYIFADNNFTTLFSTDGAWFKKSSFVTSFGNKGTIMQDNKVRFRLVITYYPAVQSEHVKYEIYRNLSGKSADLNSMNTFKSEEVCSDCPLDSRSLSELEDKSSDTGEHEYSDENECFETTIKNVSTFTTLKEDLASLYNDPVLCDTKLGTDTKTFPAHRSVLSARSPVFRKMFTTDMKERAGECINIPDISSDTIRRMLQFIYTDSTGDLEMQSAMDLYIASDKYDITSLKQICSSFIKTNLCPSNVCDVLVLADIHQDKYLEFAAQEYVLTHDEDVFGSDEWKLFMQKNSCLAAKVMYLKCIKKKVSISSTV